MKLLALVLALFVVALIASLVLKKWATRPSDASDWPFYRKRPLSVPEQVLYHRLVAALPGQIVLAQVQVARVLGVKKGSNFGHWNNRINRMSYDFVVCAKDSTVLAAIELDDRSHETPARIEADQRKERATEAAGIRLIRWQAKALPDADAIRAALAESATPVAAAPRKERGGEHRRSEDRRSEERESEDPDRASATMPLDFQKSRA